MNKIDIRDIPLEVVEGVSEKAYNAKYSIKIPNNLTHMEERAVMGGADGYHPVYDRRVMSYLAANAVSADNTGADYPVNGNTLRLYFKTLDKAHVALWLIKKFIKEEL